MRFECKRVIATLSTMFLAVTAAAITDKSTADIQKKIYVERADAGIVIPTASPTPTPEPNRMIEYYEENMKERLDDVEVSCDYIEFEEIGTFYLTAYCNCGRCTAYPNSPCADGTYPVEYPSGQYDDYTSCAIDRRLYSFGTLFYIPSLDKIVEAHDTGNLVKGRHIDIFFDNHSDVASYGSHYETIYSVEFKTTEAKKGQHYDITNYLYSGIGSNRNCYRNGYGYGSSKPPYKTAQRHH